MTSTLQIARLTAVHAAEYRALMLAAYDQAPDAFTSTVAEREGLPLSWWEARTAGDSATGEQVLGAFAGGRLVGVAGLSRQRGERTRHQAGLFGMYVLPTFRGQGLARALVLAVLDQARALPGVQLVQLTVSDTNAPAIGLYESCGFRCWGTEPMAVQLGSGWVSKRHLWHPLSPVEHPSS